MSATREDDKFVKEYEGLVRNIAQKVRAQMDLRCELDDLVAFGFQGLVEAKGRFDASRGVQFNTFAYYRIRGAIIDGVRQMAYMPRRAHAMMRAAEALDAVAEETHEARAATPEAKADPNAAVASIRDILGRTTASFVLAAVGQGDNDQPDTPEELLLGEQQKVRVKAALSVLPERERMVIQAFYFDGRTLDDAAKELGVSKSWASRMHTRGLAMLREAMENGE